MSVIFGVMRETCLVILIFAGIGMLLLINGMECVMRDPLGYRHG